MSSLGCLPTANKSPSNLSKPKLHSGPYKPNITNAFPSRLLVLSSFPHRSLFLSAAVHIPTPWHIFQQWKCSLETVFELYFPPLTSLLHFLWDQSPVVSSWSSLSWFFMGTSVLRVRSAVALPPAPSPLPWLSILIKTGLACLLPAGTSFSPALTRLPLLCVFFTMATSCCHLEHYSIGNLKSISPRAPCLLAKSFKASLSPIAALTELEWPSQRFYFLSFWACAAGSWGCLPSQLTYVHALCIHTAFLLTDVTHHSFSAERPVTSSFSSPGARFLTACYSQKFSGAHL